MICSGCGRGSQTSMGPGLICDSCWHNSRRRWLTRRRANPQPPRIAEREPSLIEGRSLVPAPNRAGHSRRRRPAAAARRAVARGECALYAHGHKRAHEYRRAHDRRMSITVSKKACRSRTKLALATPQYRPVRSH